MHSVQWMHLIAIFGNERFPPHIADGDFRKRVNGKNNYFKCCVPENQFQNLFYRLCKCTFCKMNDKNEKADKHDVDAGKIDAGHDRHAQVTVVEDTYQIADIYYSCYGAGIAKISSGSFVFLNGFHRQKYISDGNQNGNGNITFQQYFIYSSFFPLCSNMVVVYTQYKKNVYKNQFIFIIFLISLHFGGPVLFLPGCYNVW